MMVSRYTKQYHGLLLSNVHHSIIRKRRPPSLLATGIVALIVLSTAGSSNAFTLQQGATTERYRYRPSLTKEYRDNFQHQTLALESSRTNLNKSDEGGVTNDDVDTITMRPSPEPSNDTSNTPSFLLLQRLLVAVKDFDKSFRQRPPPEIEDTSVLLYDIFLLINLTASISFWVVHRLDMSSIAPAISEGCLLSTLWIASGLYSGAFLYSAVDGHRPQGGPSAASMLALNTFVNTMNLRLLFALGAAILDHRPVGTGIGEDLLGLEMGFGLVLMTVWRALHSKFVPRV